MGHFVSIVYKLYLGTFKHRPSNKSFILMPIIYCKYIPPKIRNTTYTSSCLKSKFLCYYSQECLHFSGTLRTRDYGGHKYRSGECKVKLSLMVSSLLKFNSCSSLSRLSSNHLPCPILPSLCCKGFQLSFSEQKLRRSAMGPQD